MISLLIPRYNYDVFSLVKKVHSQADALQIPYEIIILDDASPQRFDSDPKIQLLTNTRLIFAQKNLGRISARHLLAETAMYENIVFFDADVIPKYDTFLETFHQQLATSFEVIFGGITYMETPPEASQILRWKYGKARESLSVAQRCRAPYRTINSGSFMIKKSLFLELSQKMMFPRYGLDLYFKQLLQEKNVAVIHLDNPVYHMGLESSSHFLKKSLQAIETLFFLEQQHLIPPNQFPVQKAYQKLSKMGLAPLFEKIFTHFKKRIQKNLTSRKPLLILFDLFRLYHFLILKK